MFLPYLVNPMVHRSANPFSPCAQFDLGAGSFSVVAEREFLFTTTVVGNVRGGFGNCSSRVSIIASAASS